MNNLKTVRDKIECCECEIENLKRRRLALLPTGTDSYFTADHKMNQLEILSEFIQHLERKTKKYRKEIPETRVTPPAERVTALS